MINHFLIWVKMRFANITAYLLSLQGEFLLADEAEDLERYWQGELDKLRMEQRHGGLFGGDERRVR